jgi:hypothetical protein
MGHVETIALIAVACMLGLNAVAGLLNAYAFIYYTLAQRDALRRTGDLLPIRARSTYRED